MFGHSDNHDQPAQDTSSNGFGVNPPGAPEPTPDATLGGSDSSLPSNNTFAPTQPPSSSDDNASTSLPEPSHDFNKVKDDTSAAPSTSSEGGDDLIDIKQKALQQLSPLVAHLDQSPEEKFKTTMMMIQASDDQSLLPSAFESAKQITDDKARAQALLDVINEINYFTQHHNK